MMPFSSIARSWGKISSLVQDVLLGAVLLVCVLGCGAVAYLLGLLGLEAWELYW